MAKKKSEGIIFLAASADNKLIEVVEAPAGAAIGDRAIEQGTKPAAEYQTARDEVRKEIWKNWKVDASGSLVFNGKPLVTAQGPCKPKSLKNSKIL